MNKSKLSQEPEEALFAAGCFWGVEKTFANTKGVIHTEAGYSGGFLKNPSYEQVCSGRTGHAETVHLVFDPSIVSYKELIEVFWDCHDPTSLNRQGNDIGSQYRSAIFFMNEEQQSIAELEKSKLNAVLKDHGKSIQTEIKKAGPFYRAEEYHQKYWQKHPKHL